MRKLIKLLFTMLTSFSLVSCDGLYPEDNTNNTSDTDIIENTSTKSSEVKITKIAFLQDTYNVAINKEINVKYKLTPTSASKKDIIFENLNPEIFEISDETKGIIKGLSIGKGTLKLKTPKGSKATCEIVVTDDYDKNLDKNHEHEFSDEFVLVEPTCTKDGSKTYKCKYTKCNETKVEVLPKKGHTPSTNKEKAEDLLANVSDGVNKRRYYYRCTTCNKAADDSSPYEVGHGDILARSIRSTYDKTTADALINTMQRAVETVKNNYDKDIQTGFFDDKINDMSYYFYVDASRDIKFDISGLNFYLLDCLACDTCWYSGRVYHHVYTANNIQYYSNIGVQIDNEYNLYEERKEDEHYLDDIVAQIKSEQKIDMNQSDKEKVYKIYNFVMNYLTYSFLKINNIEYSNNCLLRNIKTKKATCGGYAKMFTYLCNYFGLDCLTLSGTVGQSNHAWNAVCINGKWYYVDATFGDDKSCKPEDYFLKSSSEYYSDRQAFKIYDIKLDLGTTSLSYSAS